MSTTVPMTDTVRRLQALTLNDPIANAGFSVLLSGAPLESVLIALVEQYSAQCARLKDIAMEAVQRSLPGPILFPPDWKGPSRG